ncbi:M23 family metallopeptidase [Phocaeicola coprophilus]|uniref:M23 family metallopeptidase n=1 Tax=Phocaeicola coprophilus TaxID=387090 RepID=UPI003077EE07
MCRSFSVALIVLFSLSGATAQDKRTLVAEVLQTARDFKQVASVWHIISRQEDIFRFVPSVAPLKENYRISDRFGYRVHPVSGKRTFHAGLDMAAEYAATVHAAADGTVSFSGNVPGYGKTVVITHRFGFKTRYAHLTHIYRRKGAVVTKGDVIGFVGSTGLSTGNHLHYEVIKNDRMINPINFIYGTDE